LQISLRDLAEEFSGRVVVQIDHRSPLSPCPLFTFVFAFVRRSAASDFPTSSDSLKRPLAPQRTNRLSVPVLMSSRFAAFLRPPVFFAAPFLSQLLRHELNTIWMPEGWLSSFVSPFGNAFEWGCIGKAHR
jgi:hypothetical protein